MTHWISVGVLAYVCGFYSAFALWAWAERKYWYALCFLIYGIVVGVCIGNEATRAGL